MFRRSARRALWGALVGCVVALVITGIWWLPGYRNMSLGQQDAIDMAAICVWPASLILQNTGYYASDAWDLALLIAQCVGPNAVLYGLLSLVGGWLVDALRPKRRTARAA